MLGKSVCILLSGKAGVGKSTSASIIEGLFTVDYDIEIASFAYGVKKVARDCFGWDGKKDQRGRQLLQDIGQTGRKYDQDTWVRKTFDDYIPRQKGYPFDFVVIDDWRFPNEADFIRNNEPLYSLYTVRVLAPEREILRGTPQYNDISELALDDYEFSFHVDNSVDHLHNLIKQYKSILGNILQKELIYGG